MQLTAGNPFGAEIDLAELSAAVQGMLGVNYLYIPAPTGLSAVALGSQGIGCARVFSGAATTKIQNGVFTLPSTFNGKQLRFTIIWVEEVAGTNDVYWKVTYRACESGEQINAAGETGDSGTDMIATEINLADALSKSPTHTTSGKTFETGDALFVKVERMGGDGADTSANNQEYLGLLVEAV